MSIDNATPEQWRQAAYLANFTTANAAASLTPEDIEGLNRVLDRPFGEVPYVTRAYVFLLHQMGKVHIEQFAAGEWLRYSLVRPGWAPSTKYRVRAIEKPKTKPSIDWSQIKPEYKWLARDEDGDAYVYTRYPAKHTTYWRSPYGAGREVTFMSSYTPADCDWQDSLVERPAGI